MPQPEFQCPFCERTSLKAPGLASHIRNAHPKQYPKWLKTPSRLADATKGSAAPAKAKRAAAQPATATEADRSESPVSSPPTGEPHQTLDLLKQAHAQLVERKQNIEVELGRSAVLTKELETVNTQIEALDRTLGVFESKSIELAASAS